MTLGTFEKVELRTVWGNEATDFTPWLAKPENLEKLSETLGMELETTGTEQSVGSFRADMLCKDSFSGNYVLIENQLEKTNHSHLGQILTYSAGLNIKTVIWIASSFTDEHRAALDYLNEITEEGFSFFGLEVELWKIDNSAPAVKFNVVSRPNNWTKNIREAAQHTGTITEVKQQQLAYWTAFRDFMEERRSVVRCQKGAAQHWMNMSIGRSGFGIRARVNSVKSTISADFTMVTKTSKSVYQHFLSQREAIEREYGGALEWHELLDGKESYIGVVRSDADFSNEADWQVQFDWLATNLEKFDRVFRNRVRLVTID